MSLETNSYLMQCRALDQFRKRGENCMRIADHGDEEMVTIHSCDKKEWTIPWARFEASVRTMDERGERFEIHFSLHHAILDGENLEGLMPFLKTRKITRLRALPTEFRATLPEGEPFITRVQLKALSDKNHVGEPGLPF